ncbi:hypothetical protein NL676_036549 [Syzygium grande]|nr:hypothetical protein NL676_036549 [Syzygium grande]
MLTTLPGPQLSLPTDAGGSTIAFKFNGLPRHTTAGSHTDTTSPPLRITSRAAARRRLAVARPDGSSKSLRISASSSKLVAMDKPPLLDVAPPNPEPWRPP